MEKIPQTPMVSYAFYGLEVPLQLSITDLLPWAHIFCRAFELKANYLDF